MVRLWLDEILGALRRQGQLLIVGHLDKSHVVSNCLDIREFPGKLFNPFTELGFGFAKQRTWWLRRNKDNGNTGAER